MKVEFELYKDEAGRYRFQLKVGDRIILHSGAYKSKYNCTVGIASVRNCSSDTRNFVSEQTSNGKCRFKLLASNSRVLGVGQDGRRAWEYQIALVQRLAPEARVNDRTLTVHQLQKKYAARVRKKTWLYRIYAAPRNGRGVYCPPDTEALIVQGFKNEVDRNHYWKKWIRPVTADTAGASYEYVMCDYPNNGRWRFISERRYSNAKLITGNV